MNLLSVDLAKVREYLNQTYDLKFVIQTLTQMLYALEEIHNAGYIHRDVKGHNFVFDKQKRRIFIIDFGLAKKHLDKMGKPLEQRPNAEFRGTISFASLNAHNKCDLSRRDDLWSLYFVILDFLMEKLEWRSRPDFTMEQVKEMKVRCLGEPQKYLQKGATKEVTEVTLLMKYVSYLKYDSKPDYRYMSELLAQIYNNYDMVQLEQEEEEEEVEDIVVVPKQHTSISALLVEQTHQQQEQQQKAVSERCYNDATMSYSQSKKVGKNTKNPPNYFKDQPNVKKNAQKDEGKEGVIWRLKRKASPLFAHIRQCEQALSQSVEDDFSNYFLSLGLLTYEQKFRQTKTFDAKVLPKKEGEQKGDLAKNLDQKSQDFSFKTSNNQNRQQIDNRSISAKSARSRFRPAILPNKSVSPKPDHGKLERISLLEIKKISSSPKIRAADKSVSAKSARSKFRPAILPIKPFSPKPSYKEFHQKIEKISLI